MGGVSLLVSTVRVHVNSWLRSIGYGRSQDGSPDPPGAMARFVGMDDNESAVSGTQQPGHVVVMGVSGCGKSTVAAAAAERLGWRFVEGDEFHPPQNITKMASGMALDDDDRRPWLRALADHLAGLDEPAVLSCSALKRSYRDVLRAAAPRVRFIHLHGGVEVIAGRLAARTGHFMLPALLRSQLDILEPLQSDEAGIVLDLAGTTEQLVDDAVRYAGGR